MTLDELQTTLTEVPLMVLYVSTATCNVCEDLRPRVEALVAEYDAWTFRFADAEQDVGLAGQLLVMAAPTVIFWADGREVKRFSRYVGASQIEEVLARYQALFCD